MDSCFAAGIKYRIWCSEFRQYTPTEWVNEKSENFPS